MKWEGIGPDGARVSLPAPVSATVFCDEDAPADQYTAVFPADRPLCITGLRVQSGSGEHGFTLEGIVDSREWVRSLSGCLLRVSARRRAALLLDNEAVPETLDAPSLEKLFDMHVRPYGFTGFTGDSRSFSGKLVITRGMSEWQAVEKFCTSFLRCRPHVSGRMLLTGKREPKRPVCFGREISFGRLALAEEDYQRISELRVRQQGAAGYGRVIRDPAASALGVVRRRCLSEEGERTAEQVLALARKKAFAVEVDCFQPPYFPLFTDCMISDAQIGEYTNLYISSIKYYLDKNKAYCRYTLRRKEGEACGWQDK